MDAGFGSIANNITGNLPTINQHKGARFKCFPIIKINGKEYDYTKNEDGVIINNLTAFEKKFMEVDKTFTFATSWQKRNPTFDIPIHSNLLSLNFIDYCIMYDFVFTFVLHDDVAGVYLKAEEAMFTLEEAFRLSGNKASRVRVVASEVNFL